MRADLVGDARDASALPGDEHDQVRLALNPRAMAAYLQEAIVGALPGGHPRACPLSLARYSQLEPLPSKQGTTCRIENRQPWPGTSGRTNR